MQKTHTALIFKLAAIAAAVSVQGVALAQPASNPAASPTVEQSNSASDVKRKGHFHKHHKHMSRHGHGSAAMLVPGYGPLGQKAVDELELNEEQKKLLEEARQAQKAERSERIETMKETRQKRIDTLKAGNLDPRAALEKAQEAHRAALESRSDATEKWLALWDSLNEAQKKAVGEQFVQMAEKRAERIEVHKERRAAQQDTKRAAESEAKQ